MTQRTLPQNNAYWLYCDLLAEHLNDSGFTLQACIELGLKDPSKALKVEAKWTKENIADMLGRIVMLTLWPNGPNENGWKRPDRPSSKELSTTQISEVYEVMNRATGQKWGVSMPFPSEDIQGP